MQVTSLQEHLDGVVEIFTLRTQWTEVTHRGKNINTEELKQNPLNYKDAKCLQLLSYNEACKRLKRDVAQ